MNRITDPRQYGCTELTVISQLSHMSHIWVNFIHTAFNRPTRLSLLLLIGYLYRSLHFATQMTAMWYPHSQAAYEWQMGETATHGWTHGKGMQLQNPLFSLHIVDSILTIKRKPMLQHQTSYLDSSKMVLQGLWHIRVVCEWVSRLEWKDLGRW